MSTYRFDQQSQCSSSTPSEYSAAPSTHTQPRGLPAYDWHDSQLNRRAPTFQDAPRDAIQMDHGLQPPPRHAVPTGYLDPRPRVPGQLQEPTTRDFRDARSSTDALPPTNRPYTPRPFHEDKYPPRPPAPAAPAGYYGQPEEITHVQPPMAYAWRAQDDFRQPPRHSRDRDDYEVLRMELYALKETVYYIQREMAEMHLSSFDASLRLRSSTPSLAPSDSISRVNGETDSEEFQAAYRRYQWEAAPSQKPAHLPDSVLWTFKGAQAVGPDAGFSTSNPYRPSFGKALRDSNGNPLDSALVSIIKRTALNLAGRIVALHPIKHQANKNQPRDYYRTKCPHLWYGAIILLEEQHGDVAICSAHWKADHLLGQAMVRIKGPPREAKRARSAKIAGSDSDGSVNDGKHAQQNAPATPQKSKRTANEVTPLHPGPSKRNRTGFASPKAVEHRQAAKASSKLPPASPTKQTRPQSLHSPLRNMSPSSSNRPLSDVSTQEAPKSLPPPSVVSTSSLPLSSTAPAPPTSQVSFVTKSLAAVKVDDNYENLRRTLQSPELRLAEAVVTTGLELLDAMEHAPTHGGQGFPSSEAKALLARVKTADPNCVDNEDDLYESWGHWQWTSGSLTIGTVITSWSAVGNTDMARQLIAAALATSKAARLLCLDHTPKPTSYLNDMYIDRLLSTLSDVWKRSGGPSFKGKARVIERPAVSATLPPAPPAASPTEEQSVGLAIADGLDNSGNADPMADGNLDDPFALPDDDTTALQSKLRSLHVPELRTIAAKKQIPGVRHMNKETCASALAALPPTMCPTLDELEDVIAKRACVKKIKAPGAKSAKLGSSAAAESTNNLSQTPRASRIIVNAGEFAS
ncbi:hypothetical protein PC9H_011777 [Pleurotus ostreatus]|uniref:Uncharacterized protein n=1 Tax=Pleurotus ostreatus TaxID=5322 RepID=A0A8H7DN40_PLEOS|nr:uncharacterized protein PC9H_011777 [Pleurotus ostreatus]KAF7421256.1 hypothetical protein PC9H_011777 [Pleurotus ostreatus]